MTDEARLFLTQQRECVREYVTPGSTARNLPLIFRIGKTLDSRALEISIAKIIERHGISAGNDTAPGFDLQYVDFDDSGGEDIKTFLTNRIEELTKRLAGDHEYCIFRGELIKLEKGSGYLLLNTCCNPLDTWSRDIFHKELNAIYLELTQGVPAVLPELTPSNPGFKLDTLDAKNSGITDLPVQSPVTPGREVSPAPDLDIKTAEHHIFTIPADLIRKLKQLSGRVKLTPFMMYLSIFIAMCRRNGEPEDIALGVPVSLRSQPELYHLIGHYEDTMTLRMSIPGTWSYLDLLNAVKKEVLGLMSNRDPLFNPKQSNPSNRIKFGYQPGYPLPPGHHHWPIQPVPYHSPGTKNELSYVIMERGMDVRCRITYDAGLYDDTYIRRMAGQYIEVLELCIFRPDQCIFPETYVGENVTLPSLTSVCEALTAIWEDLLGVYPIGIHDDFFQLGGYSLLAMRLLHQIERRFGDSLPVSLLITGPTIAEISEGLIESMKNRQDGLLVPLTASAKASASSLSGGPVLFFMHHKDGGILDYRELSELLGVELKVYGIQAKSEGGTLLDYVDIRGAAEYYANIIRSAVPDGPYYLAGHSFGGIIALEVARYLIETGGQVAMLGMIDARAPGTTMLPRGKVYSFFIKMYSHRLYFHLMRAKEMKGKQKIQYYRLKANEASRRFREIFRRRLKKWLKRGRNGNSVRETVSPGHARIRKLLTDSELVSRGYAGRITLFRASLVFPIYEQEDYGWGKYAADGVKVIDIPGEHGNLLKKPYANHLARAILTECMPETRGAG